MKTLTPKERLTRFMAGKPVDRVPCVPLVLNHAARVAGITVRRHATDGEAMGRAHVAAWRRYGQDMITIFSDTAIVAEAMGTELYFAEDAVPRVENPVIGAPGDERQLKAIDARTAGRLPVYLEAVRHCVREVGDEVLVGCCYASPFTTAACLRGTDMFARDLYKHPAMADVLLDYSLRAAEGFAAAVAEAGGIPVLVDPFASGSVISRAQFERYALQGNRASLAAIGKLGMPPMLHICGKTAGIIDLMADAGAAVLSVDIIDLATAVEKAGRCTCLMGNVRPTATLLDGTPESVRAEAEHCLAVGRNNPGGFVLASGCEVPIEAPPENVDAMMAVARESAAHAT